MRSSPKARIEPEAAVLTTRPAKRSIGKSENRTHVSRSRGGHLNHQATESVVEKALEISTDFSAYQDFSFELSLTIGWLHNEGKRDKKQNNNNPPPPPPKKKPKKEEKKKKKKKRKKGRTDGRKVTAVFVKYFESITRDVCQHLVRCFVMLLARASNTTYQ